MSRLSETRNVTSASFYRVPIGLCALIPVVLMILGWALGFCLSPLFTPHKAYAEGPETTSASPEQVKPDTAAESDDEEEMIEIFADFYERDDKKGVTVLRKGPIYKQVRIIRPKGFLHADKATIHEDVDTGETIKTVAEGNVEIRDEDMFATCEHAILNHIDDTVDLRDNVVVIQDADRLEASHFTLDRRTGKQTGEGGVRFKVRMKRGKQAAETTTNEAE